MIRRVSRPRHWLEPLYLFLRTCSTRAVKDPRRSDTPQLPDRASSSSPHPNWPKTIFPIPNRQPYTRMTPITQLNAFAATSRTCGISGTEFGDPLASRTRSGARVCKSQ